MWEPEEQFQWKQWYEGRGMNLSRAISRVETIARRPSWAHTEQKAALEIVLNAARKIKEEESRMKHIDFAKPLRDNMGDRLEVIQEGVTLVRDSIGLVFAVDEYGAVQHTSRMKGDGSVKVENVPEEPKDHIKLYKTAEGWKIAEYGGEQLQELKFLERQEKWFPEYKFVKVPV